MESKFLIKVVILCHKMQIFNTIFLSQHVFYSPIIDDINLYTFILCTLKFQYNYHTCNKGKPTLRLSFVTFTSIFY